MFVEHENQKITQGKCDDLYFWPAIVSYHRNRCLNQYNLYLSAG